MVSYHSQFYRDQHIGQNSFAVVSQHFHKRCNEMLQPVNQISAYRGCGFLLRGQPLRQNLVGSRQILLDPPDLI